jgi:2-polyprenyl-6-methoxyphenol hydroxylase-like FAD-dependent oxidoreductase
MADGEPDVLVVGGGPTGLTVAAVLTAAGVEVTVIDAAEGPERESSRATTVHAATLELLDRLDGAGAEIAEKAARATGSTLWNGSQRLARLQWSRMPTPYASMFNLPQVETESILRARLARLGSEVLWGTKAIGLERDDSGARLEVERAGRREALSARWVVGCDGARSAIRRSLEVPLEGSTHEERFLLGDVHLRTDLARDRTHVFVSVGGVLGVIPLADGRFRLNGTLAPGEELSPEALPALIDTRLNGHEGLSLLEIDWLAEYRTHSRLASRYRIGPVFLAGDAAHLNSPVGGQGMNAGIHDAVNLGWKLAGVVRGTSPPELLDSYEAERRPAAAAVLRASEASTRMITARRPVERALRNTVMRIAHRLPPVQAKLTLEPAGLTQTYSSGAIAKPTHGGGIQPGQRLPSVPLHTSPTRWLHRQLPGFDYDLLIVAPERSRGDLGDLARGHGVRARRVTSSGPDVDDVLVDPGGTIAAAVGARRAPTAVLVRPDGIVAWADDSSEDLDLYLRTVRSRSH